MSQHAFVVHIKLVEQRILINLTLFTIALAETGINQSDSGCKYAGSRRMRGEERRVPPTSRLTALGAAAAAV